MTDEITVIGVFSDQEKTDIFEALERIEGRFDELGETLAEVIEKIENISTPGADYDIFSEDE